MKIHFRFLSMMLLFITATCYAGESFIIPVIDKARLARAIEKLSGKYNVPDFAVTIVNKDSVLLTYEKNKAVAGKNYLIGAGSATLTSLAIMRLADEKTLSLDDPVKKHLPWFDLKNPAVARKITIRHLLSHKSGFERQHGYFDVKVNRIGDFENYLTIYLRKLEISDEPGTTFQYSCLNSILLGLIVKHATGQSFADYMYMNILPAAGMKNTWCSTEDVLDNNLTDSYQYSVAGIPLRTSNHYFSDFVIPARYISSNISDMGNYLQLMLSNAMAKGGDTLLTPGMYNVLTGNGIQGFSMGWYSRTQDSTLVINQSGTAESFSSSFSFFPEFGVGSVVLCNINSLEFCSRVDEEIRFAVFGKTYAPVVLSVEKSVRFGATIIPLLILVLLIYNLVQWRKKEAPLEYVPGFRNNASLIIIIFLSFLLLIMVKYAFNIPVGKVIRFQPDFGWSMIFIAILGTISAFLRYFSRIQE